MTDYEWYPVDIQQLDSGELEITWSDEHLQRLTPELLRSKCPCANCMEKRIAMVKAEQANQGSGPMFPIISPEPPEPLKIVSMAPVGNYAYRIEFSDRHSAGVYTLEYLRSIEPETG